MSGRPSKYYLLFAFFLLVMVPCTPSVPDRYIQLDRMEDILYDYHTADTMYQSNSEESTTIIAHKTTILKKNGMPEAEFDSSMAYYTRHIRLLQKIYESLSTRLSRETLALEVSVGEINQCSLNSVNGDTTNMWTGKRSIIFSPYRPFSLSSFTLKTDITHKTDDDLQLNFDIQFIHQDGSREAIAMSVVKFNNDSVYSRHVYVSTPDHYTLQISDNNHVGIKGIKGYFILNKGNSADAYSTTFKLVIVSNISLTRIHAPKPKRTGEAPSDSISFKARYKGRNDSLKPVAQASTSSQRMQSVNERVPASTAIKQAFL